MSERPPTTEPELIEYVRSIDVAAPEALHGRIEALVAERTGRRAPRWLPAAGLSARRALAGAMALAVVALALVVGLGGGGGSAPAANLRAASALTLKPATMAAPAESTHNRKQLAAAVDGVAFPYWEEGLGWRSVGARSDRLAGRDVKTVFYANGRGQRIGYAIVGGSPPPSLSGGVVSWRGRTPYRLLTLGGVPTVAWLRAGRLCIVSGRGVDAAALLRLASWDERGSVAA
jgi:hypothetical protein